jgi:hypothetical protein
VQSKRIPSFVYTLLLAIGFVWLFFNYQHVIDQVVVYQYKPSSEVTQVADEVHFTEKGKFLYLAAQPQLNDRDDFNKHCEKKAEQTVVLGCYLGPQHLYIYNITDPRLSGVRQVTAAHETLHAAYDRLSYVERKKVDKMIEAALPSVQKSEPDLAERLKIYDKTEPGERNNELHSILGTEAATLPPDLEAYYTQYFTNRSIITTYAAQYDKVFEDVKNQQNQLVTDLDNLATEINTLTEEYNTETTKLNGDITEFNQTANSQYSTQSEFNAARGDLLTRRNELEAKRETINSKVDEYEAKRAKLEDLNIQVKDLNSKVDSSSVPSL